MLRIYRFFHSLLNKKEKKFFIVLQFITLISSLLELISIASVVPYLAILIDVEGALENEGLLFLYNLLQFSSQDQFIIYAGLGIISLLFLSTIFSMLANWGLTRYAFHVGYKLSTRLFGFYIHQPWLYHVNVSSPELIGYITTEVDRVTSSVINPLLLMIPRVLLTVLLITSLIIFNPIASFITAAIFISSYFVVFSVLKKYFDLNSINISKTIPLRFRYLNEGFGGIKEVLIYNMQKMFKTNFETQTRTVFLYRAMNTVLSVLPRFLIEFLAFASLLGFAVFLFSSNQEAISTLTTLLVYAVAAAKLLPAIQQIYFFFGTIQGGTQSFYNVEEQMKKVLQFESSIEQQNLELKPIPFEKEIRLSSVNFQYPGKDDFTVKDLNLTIKKGEILGLVGPSGSGKSTIADLLLGLIIPKDGFLSIDGTILEKENVKNWQKMIGLVPQETFLLDASIAENIAFGENSETIDHEKLNQSIERAGLTEFIDQLSKGVNTNIGEKGLLISGGQKQRIGVARAFYRESDFIIFDEATNAQDSITEERILDSIFSSTNKSTILLIAHRLSTVKKCDSIVVCDQGEIKDTGSYEDLIVSSKLFKKMVLLNE